MTALTRELSDSTQDPRPYVVGCNDRLTTCPASLADKIFSFLAMVDIRFLKETSRKMCNQLSRYELLFIQPNPLFSWIIPTTPPINQRTDCREIVSAFNQVKKLAIQTIGTLPDDAEISDDLAGLFKVVQVTHTHLVAALHSVNAAILGKPDTTLSVTEAHLVKGNRGPLYTFLQKLAINPLLGQGNPDLIDVLVRAAADDDEAVFLEMLESSFYSPSCLLNSLVVNEVELKYIQHLLHFTDSFSASEIHQALKFAVNKTATIPAFKAILASISSKKLNKFELEEIKEMVLFQGPLLDETSRNEIIALIDSEIQMRGPFSHRQLIKAALKIGLEEISSDDESSAAELSSDDDDAGPEEAEAVLPMRSPSDADISCSLL